MKSQGGFPLLRNFLLFPFLLLSFWFVKSFQMSSSLSLFLFVLNFVLLLVLFIFFQRESIISRYICGIFLRNFLFLSLFLFTLLFLFDSEFLNLNPEYYSAKDVFPLFLLSLPKAFVAFCSLIISLSLLLTMRSLSKSSEIISLLQCGKGIFPHLRFFFLIILSLGILVFSLSFEFSSLCSKSLNARVESFRGNSPPKPRWILNSSSFGKRVWLIHSQNSDGSLNKVWVNSMDSKGVKSLLSAEKAMFLGQKKGWKFENVLLRKIQDSKIESKQFFPNYFVSAWKESPEYLLSPSLDPSLFSLPQIWEKISLYSTEYQILWREMLSRFFNALSCFIVPFLVLPFCCSFTRYQRNLVPVGILFLFLFYFSKNLCFTFFQMGAIPPLLSLFAPLLLFGSLGLFLTILKLAPRKISL